MMRRPRRNRKSAAVRAMVAETQLSVDDLIYPLFLIGGIAQKIPISSMPGQHRLSTDFMLQEIEECLKLGIKAFAPFPAIEESLKNPFATESHNPDGLYPEAIRQIKKSFPEACLVTDVAMDPYNSDGHDGLVKNGEILNDETLEILGKMALTQARAGSDIIAPSDMMDGRVGYIREVLDVNGFKDVSIMSYTAKYASSFYGPFRDALDSAPKAGDKKTYQMDPSNWREAIIEADLDYAEGADFLMVKPAMPYLDIVRMLSEQFDLPIAAYQVSGEYAMLKAAAEKGYLNGKESMLESLLGIKRAGASLILTYFAREFAEMQL